MNQQSNGDYPTGDPPTADLQAHLESVRVLAARDSSRYHALKRACRDGTFPMAAVVGGTADYRESVLEAFADQRIKDDGPF